MLREGQLDVAAALVVGDGLHPAHASVATATLVVGLHVALVEPIRRILESGIGCRAVGDVVGLGEVGDRHPHRLDVAFLGFRDGFARVELRDAREDKPLFVHGERVAGPDEIVGFGDGNVHGYG